MSDDVIPIRKPEIIGQAGGLVDQSSVTLALYGDDLDPDAVSQRLGCSPTRAHRKGDGARPTRPTGFAKGVWLLTVEGTPPNGPDELVSLLFERFPKEQEFWAALRESYTVKVLFGIHVAAWNRGFELRASSVTLIAATGALVGFDLYCYPEGE